MKQLRPMNEFDPTKRAIVHDEMNDKSFEWQPEWAGHYREYATQHTEGVIGWDGLLLDGWTPAS
jgi:hypothetical protein